MLTTWSFPTTVVFGACALSALAGHVKRFGLARVLLVTDAGVARAGIASRVQDALQRGDVTATIFDKVDANPVEQNIVDGVEAYRAAGAQAVVAVGGGSPLDAGKLIALKVTHDRPLADYDDALGGDRHIQARSDQLR